MLTGLRRGRAILLLAAALLAAPASAQPASGNDPRLVPAPGIKVDSEFIRGLWSDKEDCRERIDFRADGQFVNDDGSHGTWRIDGDNLTLTGTSSVTVRIVPQSRDEITVVNPDSTLGWSRRCPR